MREIERSSSRNSVAISRSDYAVNNSLAIAAMPRGTVDGSGHGGASVGCDRVAGPLPADDATPTGFCPGSRGHGGPGARGRRFELGDAHQRPGGARAEASLHHKEIDSLTKALTTASRKPSGKCDGPAASACVLQVEPSRARARARVVAPPAAQLERSPQLEESLEGSRSVTPRSRSGTRRRKPGSLSACQSSVAETTLIFEADGTWSLARGDGTACLWPGARSHSRAWLVRFRAEPSSS